MSSSIFFFQQREYAQFLMVKRRMFCKYYTNIAITTSQMDASAPKLCLASTSLDYYTYSITIKELIKQQRDRQWKSDHHI